MPVVEISLILEKLAAKFGIDILRYAVKKLAQSSPAKRAINATVLDFPHIPSLKESLTKWLKSDHFDEFLKRISEGAQISETEWAELLVSDGGFFSGSIIHNYEDAGRVVRCFAAHLEDEMLKSEDGLSMIARRIKTSSAEEILLPAFTPSTKDPIELLKSIQRDFREVGEYSQRSQAVPQHPTRDFEAQRAFVRMIEKARSFEFVLEESISSGRLNLEPLVSQFVEVFDYIHYNKSSIQLCIHLSGSAERLLALTKGLESKIIVQIATELGVVKWLLREEQAAQYYHNQIALPMAEALYKTGKVSAEFTNDIKFRIYDYARSIDSVDFEEWGEICHSWHDEAARPDKIVAFYQCSACKYLRVGDLAKVSECLGFAWENLNRVLSDKGPSEQGIVSVAYHNSYLNLIEGIYNYRRFDFDSARKLFEQAVNPKSSSMLLRDWIGVGIGYYFLFKIEYFESGHTLASRTYRDFAKRHLQPEAWRNYCIAIPQELLAEIEKNEAEQLNL
jgi:hypothetical protein